MNPQNLSNETLASDMTQQPLNKNPKYEQSYHSSQIKRPYIYFNDPNQNTFDINKNQRNLNQSFNSNNYNFSKISKNLYEKNYNIINNNNLNILNIKKSVQQEKYDAIKKYCLKKNDPESYPLISYENFLLVDSLTEKNSGEYEAYKNLLYYKNVSIELFSKFSTLLMNRYIISKENNLLNKYPKVVYQVIFDMNNLYNFLSPDIVADAKQSNIFAALVNYENMWNVLIINQNNNYCNYFMFNKNMDKEIILSLMNTVTQTINPYINFEFSVSDYSGFSPNNQIILPFIILEFFSRYKDNLPNDDEDYYYQTILILSEIMTNNLITK